MSDFDFDVNDFMAASYDTANSTQQLKLPDGYEGYALVTEVKLEKIPNGSVKMVAKLEFSGDEIKGLVKRDKLTDNADFFIDLVKDANGKTRFDMSEGMNAGLGQFRAALGVNKANQSWRPIDSVGRSVKVKHKLDPDKNDSSKIYSRYRFVASL